MMDLVSATCCYTIIFNLIEPYCSIACGIKSSILVTTAPNIWLCNSQVTTSIWLCNCKLILMLFIKDGTAGLNYLGSSDMECLRLSIDTLVVFVWKKFNASCGNVCSALRIEEFYAFYDIQRLSWSKVITTSIDKVCWYVLHRCQVMGSSFAGILIYQMLSTLK